ncbi:T7SS effector LXG polymorphic toxin [Listeria monocytogenes]|uniref:T7SS effector LXG polymorphic toxin n=1 Tax=Listeria monocytogenes TaxID=1639 RepID=UPI000873D3D7|nr:T7SS effector LXG polymorphic toxin [Listeria monocytogenes]EAD8868673.1 hypothetical protein [Listeria monocytogenes]OFF88640.1 hypothetical protein BJM62_03810 [Listeria monocytogenes]
MTRIDIAEVNHFSHELKTANQQAKTQITAIYNTITAYLQDDSLSGEAISASKGYYIMQRLICLFVLLSNKRYKSVRNL